jgi:hypothetical protein
MYGEQQARPVALDGEQQAGAGDASQGAAGWCRRCSADRGRARRRAPPCHQHWQRRGAGEASSFEPEPGRRASSRRAADDLGGGRLRHQHRQTAEGCRRGRRAAAGGGGLLQAAAARCF